MKILLVNPNSTFLMDDKVFPSLGLLYLSAYLKANGYQDIELIDLNGGHELPDAIEADIVGFYSNTPQFPHAKKLSKEIKNINAVKDALYIIGGPHVSGNPEDALQDFDIIVVGEGERILLDIVRNKEAKKTLSARILKCGYEKDIDRFPFPDRDLIDIKSYKYFLNKKLTTTLVTSRGCPFGCNFCANNVWGKTLRMRSPQNVFEEVALLKDKYGYEAFMFFDDTMTVDKKRMQGICALLKGLKIIYRCFIRSDTVDRQVLELMRDSGCVEVGIGLESGSQRILDIVNKGETTRKNMEAIKLCHQLGIRVKGFIIIGLPGENSESIRETTEFLAEAGLDDIDVTIYTPYPGSIIYKQKDRFDIQFHDDYEHAWFKGKPGFYKSLVSTSGFSSEEIADIRDKIEGRFKKKPHNESLSYIEK